MHDSQFFPKVTAIALAIALSSQAYAASRYDELANLPFKTGFPTKASSQKLADELIFQRATQAYLWSLPAINIWAMKEASEKQFGAGYNILPTWKGRINAKTLVTTPNSDLVYAMSYLDLKKYGPLVVEAPPGVQGMFDDFFQRPLVGPTIEGKTWRGDVGLAGPDKGKGGTYVLLPPDYNGPEPKEGFVYRSRTNNVFLFWRTFFKNPADLTTPVAEVEQTHIYPLGQKDTALPMQFPDATGAQINMLFPHDGAYFDMLSRVIEAEAVDPADMDMRGFLHTLGIEKGKPFAPDTKRRKLLDQAARTAFKMSKVISNDLLVNEAGGLYYKDRQYVNTFAGENTEFQSSGSYTNLEQRVAFFTSAYSDSPGMVMNIVGAGAKYPATSRDADGNYLDGGKSYKMTLPADVPAALFWSVTAYDGLSASGMPNGQAFPSLNQMDKPVQNADGSTDIYFGPTSPGAGKNWIQTVKGKGVLVIVRLYGPKQAFFDQTWKPGDLHKQ